MCGIAGYIDKSGASDHWGGIKAMLAPLDHRGPDGQGEWHEGPASLGHKRLSIIDLEGGTQPMADASGRFIVTFNGEIYNFAELRDHLISAGIRLTTRSDTEILPNLFALEGPEMLKRLRGMFAFAVWDRKEQTLFLARDRVGIKPLFYSRWAGGIGFASEISGLLLHPKVSKEECPDALANYFVLNYIPEPASAYKDVLKIPAGHWAKWSPRGFHLEKYWDLPPVNDESEIMGFEECLESLDGHFRDSVKCRMISDVPLGAFLSGGLDSGLVVSYMAELSDRPVKTFSIGFSEEKYNELPLAREVSKYFQTEHHEEIVKPKALDLIDIVGGMFKEPFGDSSALPTYLVSKMARQEVTVCLSGDGGDEGFAGYTRYQKLDQVIRFQSVPRILRRALGWGASLVDLPRFRQVQRLCRRSLLEMPENYFQGVNSLVGGSVLNQKAAERAGQRCLKIFEELFREEGPVRTAQYLDMKTYLVNDILTKVDRASMAVSLEARVPLLDHLLLEWANQVPTKYKFDGKHKKLLLRELARKRLPPAHLSAPKRGFALPLADWFRGELKPLVMEFLSVNELKKSPWINPSEVENMVSRHMSGREDLSQQLWSLLVFQIWRGRT